MVKSSFGLAVLAWKSYATLERSLSLLQPLGDDVFVDRVVFFQDMSTEDEDLAARYGFRAVGNDENVGIREGIKQAVSCCQADIVLFLECDLMLMDGGGNVAERLRKGADMLHTHRCDVVRFLSLSAPGEVHHSNKFFRFWYKNTAEDSWRKKLQRFLHPVMASSLLSRAVFWVENPQDVYGDFVHEEEGFYVFSSAVCTWSNQAFMVRKDWFLDVLIPYAESHPSSGLVNGFQDLEKELNCFWWRAQRFVVCHDCVGFFTHQRLDRPIEDEKNSY